MELDSKIFDQAEQARFAHLSGDRNPLHLDAVAARRTQMGAPVVHGIHAVLWALEAAFRREKLSPVSIQLNFLAPIYVGETASATLERRSHSDVRITISAAEALTTVVTLKLGIVRQSELPVNNCEAQTADWPRFPIELDFDHIKTQAGAFAFARHHEHVADEFPALCRAISPQRVAAIVALSRLVGMICPGLHSILKSFSLDLTEVDATEDAIRYAAVEVCERMSLVRMRVSGPGVAGEVAAFRRAPPIAQPAMEAVAARVPKGSYTGATVLVIGGSRGLGEVTAKACAAGGAAVHITYATGRADAERVAGEIVRHGGTCGVYSFDVRGNVRAQLSDIPVAPTHLYYFASRPMPPRRSGFLNASDLDDLLCVFAKGFFETCDALLAKAPGRELRAFYPSSAAVAEAPRGLTEYAMAKAAGEVLCENMNRHATGVRVLYRRLPRMLTDQTANVLRAESSPVLDILLPIVSEMQTPGESTPLRTAKGNFV